MLQVKTLKKIENKGSQMGHTKKVFKKKIHVIGTQSGHKCWPYGRVGIPLK
jgi:hypothetical protein